MDVARHRPRHARAHISARAAHVARHCRWTCWARLRHRVAERGSASRHLRSRSRHRHRRASTAPHARSSTAPHTRSSTAATEAPATTASTSTSDLCRRRIDRADETQRTDCQGSRIQPTHYPSITLHLNYLFYPVSCLSVLVRGICFLDYSSLCHLGLQASGNFMTNRMQSPSCNSIWQLGACEPRCIHSRAIRPLRSSDGCLGM